MGVWCRGWYDPDRKKRDGLKLEQAVERFGEVRPGVAVELVLTNQRMKDDPDFAATADRLGLVVEAAPYIPAFTIYCCWRDPNRDPEIGS